MPGDAEEGTEVEMLPLVLRLLLGRLVQACAAAEPWPVRQPGEFPADPEQWQGAAPGCDGENLSEAAVALGAPAGAASVISLRAGGLDHVGPRHALRGHYEARTVVLRLLPG